MTSSPRSFSLLAPLLLLLLSTRPAAAQPTEASRAFAEGSQLFEKGDYVGAIEAFNRAYRLKPHFSVLCNIALSHERQGNMVAAAASYRACLKGAGRSASGAAVKNSLQRVEGRITWVQVRSPGEGGTVFLDGQRVGPAPQRVAVNPGSHVIEVRRPGADPARQSLTTRGGEEQEMELVPSPIAGPQPKIIVVKERGPGVAAPPSRRRLRQVWFWSGVGVTAALALVATVLGVQTLRTHTDYEEHPSRDLLDQGVSYRTLTNVFWGLTAAAGGATTVLFFYTDFSRRRAESSSPTGEVVVGVRGSF